MGGRGEKEGEPYSIFSENRVSKYFLFSYLAKTDFNFFVQRKRAYGLLGGAKEKEAGKDEKKEKKVAEAVEKKKDAEPVKKQKKAADPEEKKVRFP